MLSHQQPDLSILVVDDHELTRLYLKLALSQQQNIKLTGFASNGEEAVEMVKKQPTDLVILDLQMPVMDGLSASIHIKHIDPEIKIIAYSSWEDINRDLMAQEANIDQFCRKDVPTAHLINLINQVGQQALKS